MSVLLDTEKKEMPVSHAPMDAKNAQTLYTVNYVLMKQAEMQMDLVHAHKKHS